MTSKDVEYKAKCPCCDYDAGCAGGVPRSDNVRKHILRKHADVAAAIESRWIDGAGRQLRLVGPKRAIKSTLVMLESGEADFRDYVHGFCFECCSYIDCGHALKSNTAEMRVRCVLRHECPERKARGPRPPATKAGAGSPPAPSTPKVVPAPAPAPMSSLSAIDGVWEALKADKRLESLRLADTEKDARRDYDEDDPDSTPFDAMEEVIVLLLTTVKTRKGMRQKDEKITELEIERDRLLDKYEMFEREMNDLLAQKKSGLEAVLEASREREDALKAKMEAEREALTDEINRLHVELCELKAHLPAATSAAASAADAAAASAASESSSSSASSGSGAQPSCM